MLQKNLVVSGLFTDGKNCKRIFFWTPVILTVKSWVKYGCRVERADDESQRHFGWLARWLARFWISLLWICPHVQSPDDSGTVQGRTIMMRRSIALSQNITRFTWSRNTLLIVPERSKTQNMQSAKTISLLSASTFVNWWGHSRYLLYSHSSTTDGRGVVMMIFDGLMNGQW